jgi:DNA-directed RNA polymerase omega subunit
MTQTDVEKLLKKENISRYTLTLAIAKRAKRIDTEEEAIFLADEEEEEPTDSIEIALKEFSDGYLEVLPSHDVNKL